MFALKQEVQQNLPVVTGVIVDRRLNNEKNELEYLVEYPLDKDGHAHQVWYTESQIKAV